MKRFNRTHRRRLSSCFWPSAPHRPRLPGSPSSRSPSSCPGAPADRPTRSRESARLNWKSALGQKIVIVNQPGASGSVGTKNALDAREGRLHLDCRRRRGPGHLQGPGHARHRHPDGLECLPLRGQRMRGRRQRGHALQVFHGSPGRVQEEPRADHGRHGGAELRGPYRYRVDPQVHRDRVQARHLRRRQSRGHRLRLRRGPGHHPAGGGAGRHDTRQEDPPARRPLRQAAGDRRATGRSRPVTNVDQGFQDRPQLLRDLHSQGSPARKWSTPWRRPGGTSS